MANAVILVGGYVKKSTKLTKIRYNIRIGYVVRFELNGKVYAHVNKNDFRRYDQQSMGASGGYYEEEEFLKYLATPNYTLAEINQSRLRYESIENATKKDVSKGIVGDSIKVSKLDIVFPYENFLTLAAISWEYVDLKFLDVDNIKVPPPPISTSVPQKLNLNTIANDFYIDKIPLVNGPHFTNIDLKNTAAYYITAIALQIHHTVTELYPLFEDDDFDEYISSQNNEWTSSEIFNNPTIEILEAYYASISSFYRSVFSDQLFIKKANTKTKLYWLANCLSVDGLRIIPVSDKIKLLELIADGVILESSRVRDFLALSPVNEVFLDPVINEERFLLDIVESVSLDPERYDEFLERLVDPNDNTFKITLFERLYNGLDDNRIKRYTLSLLADGDNKMKFVDLINVIWQKSKFNPNYKSPDYTQPPVFGAYLESFFLTPNGAKYYDPVTAPPFLIYVSSPVSDPGHLDSFFTVSYKYELKGLKIEVDQIIITTKRSERLHPQAKGYETTQTTQKYGSYHLLQPITIIGFKPQLELKIPKEEIIPIVYIYYMVQYSAIKYLDYSIVFTAEVALNFIGIGELANLKYLGYLKNLSKMGGALLPEEAVLTWTAVQGVSDAFVFTGANTSAVLSFISDTTTDPQTKEAADSANEYLGYLLLSSLSSSYFLRGKVTQAALDLSIQLDNLTHAGIPYILDGNTENVIRSLGSNEELVNSFTRNKLLEIPQAGSMVQTYDAFGSALKYKFGKDYGEKAIDELTLLKNNNAITPMDNYKLLAEQELLEAKSISFLLEQKRVVALDKYAKDVGLKKNAYQLTQNNRDLFLDHFGNPTATWFEYLKNDPTAITRWGKLDSYGKLFAKQKPGAWLYKFDRLYENLPKVNRLSTTEILERFGQEGLQLVNEVEAFALNHIAKTGANQRKLRDILISGMRDKNASISSDFFTNFSEKQVLNGEFDEFVKNMFPNLKTRIDDIALFNKENYRMTDNRYAKNTGPNPGAHAEVRALDDLAKKRFINPPTDEEFDAWLKNDVLGYNRNIEKGIGQEDVIMHTCADCYHILYLVTFIRPL